MSRARRRGLWCALGCYLCFASAGSAQTVDALKMPTDIPDVGSQLQDWDQAQLALRDAVWRTYAATAAVGTDARGRRIAQDIEEWVMTDQASLRLRKIRAQADQQHRAGDEQAARATLQDGQAALQEQWRRLSLISYYWQQKIVLDRHRDLWRFWLAQQPENVAAESKAHMQPFEEELRRQFSAEADLKALTVQIDDLKHAYNDERSRLAGLISDRPEPPEQILLSRDRRTPCLEGEAAETGRSEARGGATVNRDVQIAKDPPPKDFYPEDARRSGISGAVTLQITVAANGCMQHAKVLRSSGAPELDEAAIELSEYASYLPAQRGGQPVSSNPSRTIRFQLDEPAKQMHAIPQSPATAGSHISHGNDLLNQGEYDLAIAEFDQALAVNPKADMALADRGMAQLAQRNYDLARQDFDAAFAINGRNAVVFRGRGTLALIADNYPEATAAYTTSLEIDPNNAYALIRRGRAYWLAGDPDKALADSAEVIRSRPDSLDMYSFRATILRAQHKAAEAIGEAEAAIAANPNKGQAYVVAGQIYAASGQYAEAMRTVDRAVQVTPDESTYLSRASFRRREDTVGRRADIDAALKLNAHSVPALTQLARIQAEAREFTSALATIDGAIAIQGDTADLLIARGIVHSMADQDALAERDFAAARAKAVNPQALNSMCWTLATAGISLATALAACEAALAGAPNDGAIHDSRGLVLLRQGRYQEAIASYDSALKLRPMTAVSLYCRGLAKQLLGHAAAGSDDIEAALAFDASVADMFIYYGLPPAARQ